MNKTTQGWVIFIASLGMMCSLMAADISKLTTWNQATTPLFISDVLAHFSVVVGAFIGGKLIPESREGKQTRSTDNKSETDNKE